MLPAWAGSGAPVDNASAGVVAGSMDRTCTAMHARGGSDTAACRGSCLAQVHPGGGGGGSGPNGAMISYDLMEGWKKAVFRSLMPSPPSQGFQDGGRAEPVGSEVQTGAGSDRPWLRLTQAWCRVVLEDSGCSPPVQAAAGSPCRCCWQWLAGFAKAHQRLQAHAGAAVHTHVSATDSTLMWHLGPPGPRSVCSTPHPKPHILNP